MSAVQNLEDHCEKIMTPLQRFEHGLTPWVSFLIIPLFALANAGVSVGGNFADSITDTISIGIITGLFIGKQAGIFIFSWLAIKLGIAAKPEGIKWRQIYAVGILGGIGFTMSLFITNLAFTDPKLIDTAKIGILTASLLSGILGYIILSASGKKTGAAD
jgi:NhaA family Na+:H+ antiporter